MTPAPISMPVRDWREEQRIIRRDLAEYARVNRAAIDAEWNALPEQMSPVEHARRHMASLPPERREQLDREWRGIEHD